MTRRLGILSLLVTGARTCLVRPQIFIPNGPARSAIPHRHGRWCELIRARSSSRLSAFAMMWSIRVMAGGRGACFLRIRKYGEVLPMESGAGRS
jgi:hypothetical protein